MVNSLRNYGDGNTIVLYTDDDQIYKQLKKSRKLIREIPYWHKQYKVGCDLYFDRKHSSWLQKQLASLDPYESGDF